MVPEDSVVAFSLAEGRLAVARSCLKSGGWWTTMEGIGVTWFDPSGLLATQLLVDG